jgi:hypothetical protein
VNLAAVVAGTIKAEGTANATADKQPACFPSSIGVPAYQIDNLLVRALARDRLTPLRVAHSGTTSASDSPRPRSVAASRAGYSSRFVIAGSFSGTDFRLIFAP